MNRREFVLSTAAGLAATGLARKAHSEPGQTRVEMEDVQQLVDGVSTDMGLVGSQLALFDGERIHEFCFGYANLEAGLKVSTETLFQIGSTTKVFNAAVIMSLVDQGALDLDSPVKTWIKDFKLADQEATDKVCLRQLLSMSAGIDNGPYQDHGRGDDALGRYVASLADVPMIFKPGSAYGYSNASTNISGFAAQSVSNKPWESLLEENILAPLSLNQTASLPEYMLYHPLALGYMYKDGSNTPERAPFWNLPRSMAPAGSTLCSSAGDLVRFAQMFLRGGTTANGTQVISSASIEAMQTPQVSLPTRLTAHKWCVGPYWKEWDGVGIFGHTGTNAGGSSALLWCPERNFAIATITNVPKEGYPFADRIFSKVFPAVFGIKKPQTIEPAKLIPAVVNLDRHTGTFESLGQKRVFSIEDGKLVVRAYFSDTSADPALTTELVPLGGDRFQPLDSALSGGRGWDVAFWGEDSAGKAAYFLDGVFAMRKTA